MSDTVIRTVSNFVQARPAVLHIDDLINKKKNNEVRFERLAPPRAARAHPGRLSAGHRAV